MLDLATFAILLIFLGFAIVFLAIVLSIIRTAKGERPKTDVKGGGVIMIGPIPIIMGSDAKWATLAIILAIALTLISLILYQIRI